MQLCYVASPFFGDRISVASEKERSERPQISLVRVKRAGQNNIKLNPVFRGMIRRKRELITKENCGKYWS